MTMESVAIAAYLVAALLFIMSLAGLSKHESAKSGIWFGIAGMVIAVLATFVIGTSASQAQNSSAQIEAARKGPVAKLIELERRKNEWLRQKFGR